MAVFLSPVFGVAGQVFDDNGNPLAGGKIYTYLAGTTTPAATYTTSLGSVAHTNPIVLDGAGRVPSGEIWLTDGIVYKFVVEDANSVLIGTYDNLTGINSNFVAFTNEQEIQTATAGQTVFNLATVTYQPGTNSLSVFVDGVNQYGPGAQYAYVETDSDTVTFVSGLHVGASVKFTTSQLNTSGAADASQVSYTPPFVGSVTTNVEDKLAQTISAKDFGALGDGTTDDTTALQSAIDAAIAANQELLIDGGIYIASTLTINGSLSINGSATIKQKDNTSGSLFSISGTSVNAKFSGLTFDGNESNQPSSGGSNRTINFTSSGTTNSPATIYVEKCTFLNGCGYNIRISTNSALSTVESVTIVNNNFVGGRACDSNNDVGYIQLASPCSYVISGNNFNFVAGVQTSGGRAGVVTFDGFSAASLDKAYGVISNNVLTNVGKSFSIPGSGILGAIDIYNWGKTVTVANNVLYKPVGRGIQTKADITNLVIANNVVEGGYTPDGHIVVNSSVNTYANNSVTIIGNSSIDASDDSIVVTGRNSTNTLDLKDASVIGNSIYNAGIRGINITDVDTVTISGNTIDTTTSNGILCTNLLNSINIVNNNIKNVSSTNPAIYIAGGNTSANVSISNNMVSDGRYGIQIATCNNCSITNNFVRNSTFQDISIAGVAGINQISNNVFTSTDPYVRGTNTGVLQYQNNQTTNQVAAGQRNLTIASGIINAVMDWHRVDTEGAAASDDLDTINGGYDGRMLTLHTVNAGRVVTLKDNTGNLRLAGDFAMDNPFDSITLQYVSTNWYEISRSNNA